MEVAPLVTYMTPSADVFAKTPAAAGRNIFYDVDGNVTAEKNSSTWPVKYVYLGGQLIALNRDSTTYSISCDHTGSTRVITKLDKGDWSAIMNRRCPWIVCSQPWLLCTQK